MNDVLCMLDEHYGVIMMFDALSKELYSLKQGLSKNVAELGVHLSQQVQIHQSEYPGGIHLEYWEEMKCDWFYEGLNPGHKLMLAHKVDSEHPASYSDLPLAAQKLERGGEARNPLPPMMTATNGTNVMHSQMSGNLFPLGKLKGNCTFLPRAVTAGNDMAEEDPSVEQEGEEGTAPSAD